MLRVYHTLTKEVCNACPARERKCVATALLTDLYQLTMAYGYWKLGKAEQPAVFHLFFRKPPFGGGYALAAGLAPALDFIENFRFDASDIDFLRTLVGNNGAAAV